MLVAYHFSWSRIADILLIVRYMTPPFGMYTALSAEMAGSLRHTHSRLVEFAEEVAFMRGEHTEKMLIEREYAASVAHENHVLQRRWWFGCVEEGIIKWLWGSFGVRFPKDFAYALELNTPLVHLAYSMRYSCLC